MMRLFHFSTLLLMVACAPVASVSAPQPAYAVTHETDEFTKSERSDLSLLDSSKYDSDLDCGTRKATLLLQCYLNAPNPDASITVILDGATSGQGYYIIVIY